MLSPLPLLMPVLMTLLLMTQQFPCFGAVVLTFMEKPFINFQFSLGKLEVMGIGPGDMNVGNVVSDLIKNIISDLMVFPAKLPVPILEDQDIVVSFLYLFLLCVFTIPHLGLDMSPRRSRKSIVDPTYPGCVLLEASLSALFHCGKTSRQKPSLADSE